MHQRPILRYQLPVNIYAPFRSKQGHDQRRRIWNPDSRRPQYEGCEQRLRPYRMQLMKLIAEVDDGTPLNIRDCCIWYSFDVIRGLALDKSYGNLQKQAMDGAVQAFLDNSEVQKYMLSQWGSRLIMTMPMLLVGWVNLKKEITQDLLHRMKSEPDIPGVCAYFLAPLKGRDPTPADIDRIQADVELLIAAGGDTVGMTLSACIYELARRPEHVEKIREELGGCD